MKMSAAILNNFIILQKRNYCISLWDLHCKTFVLLVSNSMLSLNLRKEKNLRNSFEQRKIQKYRFLFSPSHWPQIAIRWCGSRPCRRCPDLSWRPSTAPRRTWAGSAHSWQSHEARVWSRPTFLGRWNWECRVERSAGNIEISGGRAQWYSHRFIIKAFVSMVIPVQL